MSESELIVIAQLAAAAGDCPLCGRSESVVSPDFCTEGHGGACPDRICLDCGAALLIDPVVAAGAERSA